MDRTGGAEVPGGLPAAAADLLHTPACVVDRDGNVLHLNAAWRAFAGPAMAREAVRWETLLRPLSPDKAMAYLRDAPDGGKQEFECELFAGTAPRAFVLALHRLDGTPAQWLCTATDVQALRRRERELERRESSMAAMLDVSVDCIKVIDLEGNLVQLNRAGSQALGVPEKPPPGTRWLSLLTEDVRESGSLALAAALQGKPGRFPGRSACPGQPVQHWDNLLTPLLDARGHTTAVLCVSRDVTAEHDARQGLIESEQRLVIAARVGGLGIWDYDIAHNRLYCDPSWYRIMGRDEARPIRTIGELRPLIHPDDVDTATEVSQTAAELASSKRDYSIIFRIVRPDGEVRWLRSLAYVHEEGGVPVRAVGFVTDITESRRGELALRDANRALEDERRSLARKVLEDALTGIPNRRHLDTELAHICARAEASGEPLCIGMIDVDRFKQFNDRYGHVEGDAALRQVASTLRAVAGPSNLVARYGGEEFTFVLPDCADPEPFLQRFAAGIAALGIPHADSPSGHLTTSAGAIIAVGPALQPTRLLTLGDQALYDAKLAGRNCYTIRIASPH